MAGHLQVAAERKLLVFFLLFFFLLPRPSFSKSKTALHAASPSLQHPGWCHARSNENSALPLRLRTDGRWRKHLGGSGSGISWPWTRPCIHARRNCSLGLTHHPRPRYRRPRFGYQRGRRGFGNRRHCMEATAKNPSQFPTPFGQTPGGSRVYEARRRTTYTVR